MWEDRDETMLGMTDTVRTSIPSKACEKDDKIMQSV